MSGSPELVYMLTMCVGDGPQTVLDLFGSLESAQRAVSERSGRADLAWSGSSSTWWTLTGDQADDASARMWIVQERRVAP